MASIRDLEFFARPIRGGYSLRQRYKKDAASDPDGTEWAILALRDGRWEADAVFRPFQKHLDDFLGRVTYQDREVAFKACKYAYEAFFHGEEVEEGPWEGIAALAGEI